MKLIGRMISGKEVAESERLPKTAHWQILIQAEYTPYSGYENESGGGVSQPRPYMRIFVYHDQVAWQRDVVGLSRDPETTGRWAAAYVVPPTITVDVQVQVK